MKITSQEEYGLRCLLRLACAEGQAATLPEIAAAEGLSVPYVAKLFGVLRQAGLIDSIRGRSGGYRLVKPPEEIGLGSLLLVLGEPLFDEPTYCQKHAGNAEDGNCVRHGDCSLRALWQTLEQWVRGSLDQITLADLLRKETRITELVRSRLSQTIFADSGPLISLTPLTR
ncbi:MAG: Rrf2 family transcriptional regulator [Planctomycetes bacterium]|nr:Rrf2 family transcriptional regulator [Planctomycetota bacterium]